MLRRLCSFVLPIVLLGGSLPSHSALAESKCEELARQGQLLVQQLRHRRACAPDAISSVGGIVCGFYADKTIIGLRGLRKYSRRQRQTGHSGAGFVVARVDFGHEVRLMVQKIGLVVWINRRPLRGGGGCPTDIAIIDADGRIYDAEQYIRSNR